MKAQAPFKPMSVNSTFKWKLLAILILAVSTAFVWMATEPVIAPPLVRAGDILYRLFICRCFFQFIVI